MNDGTERPVGRAGQLIAALGLVRHPEGGWYREVFRSTRRVVADGGRGERQALTTIDFLLAAGEFSAWHRVRSDEVWHLLEGRLRLWLVPAELDRVECVALAAVDGQRAPRHVVPADWWQAAEPLGELAYVGATVGPGFEFADFAFGRDDTALVASLARTDPALQRLL